MNVYLNIYVLSKRLHPDKLNERFWGSSVYDANSSKTTSLSRSSVYQVCISVYKCVYISVYKTATV